MIVQSATKPLPKTLSGLHHWQVLLDAIVTPATVFDHQLVFLAQNKAHEDMTGTSRVDVLGRYMFDAFPAEPRPNAPSAEDAIRSSVYKVVSTRAADTLPVQEHALQNEKGEWESFFWRMTHAPLFEDGEVAAILQTSENVTEATLERDLAEAQQLAVEQATNVSFFSYELESDLFVRSAAVDALFGFEPNEAGLLAAPFFERISPHDLPAVQSELDRLKRSPLKTPAEFDYRVERPGSNAVRFVRGRGAMVVDPRDRKRKLVGVLVDMTDVAETQNRLEQLVQDKENLLIEVNHRVKNSLQLASSVLRMEARKADTEDVRDVLATANARVDAIAEVHGETYIGGDVTRVSTSEILKNIVSASGRSVGAGDTSASIECDAAEFSLPTDLAIAFGLLVNELLTNAIKYGGAGSARAIRVATVLGGDAVVLSVSNDKSREVGDGANSGTGIGTSLISGFVRQLGGTLSNVDHGDRFEVTVVFPLHDE